jgi:hypothetical protein
LLLTGTPLTHALVPHEQMPVMELDGNV